MIAELEFITNEKSHKRDSNSRPPDYKSGALPTELLWLLFLFSYQLRRILLVEVRLAGNVNDNPITHINPAKSDRIIMSGICVAKLPSGLSTNILPENNVTLPSVIRNLKKQID
jgi:hypothetical protein